MIFNSFQLRSGRLTLIVATATLILFASCSKSNKEGKMIPKNAGVVLDFNLKSISEKISLAELRQMDAFQQLVESHHHDSAASDILNKFLSNPGYAGLDTTSHLLVVVEKNDYKTKIALIGGLKDASAFSSFLKQVHPEAQQSKEGEINWMSAKDKGVITWNNDHFVIGMQQGQETEAMEIFSPDSTGGPKTSTHYQDIAISNIPEVKAYCLKLYSLKDDENMTKDEKFTELMKKESDFRAYVNADNLMGSNQMMEGMMSMMKMDVYTKGNISTYALNFEKGKVVLKTKNYFSKELSDVFKKYGGGSINTDMIKMIPSKNVAAVISVHFDPKGIDEAIKLSGFDVFLDLMLARQAGFTISDFVKANKGDVMIAITDPGSMPDTAKFDSTSFHRDKFNSKFLFVAAINDKSAFNKLINAGQKFMDNDFSGHYANNEKYFAIGNDADQVNQYIKGDKQDQSFIDKISGSPVGAYVDIQKILTVVEPDPRDTLEQKVKAESLKIWDYAIATGGNYKGGGLNQDFEVNLMDKNTNSLQQLFKYGLTMAAITHDKQKQMEFKHKDNEKAVVDSITKVTTTKVVKKKKK